MAAKYRPPKVPNASVCRAAAAVLGVFVVATSPLQAEESWRTRGTAVAVDGEVCAPYRKGPLVTAPIAIRYEPAYLNAASYTWTDIFYRKEYLAPMMMGGPLLKQPKGAPEDDQFFFIGLSGDPVSPTEYSRRPSEDSYFQLLIRGATYQLTPEDVIGAYSNSKVFRESTQKGEMVSGFYVRSKRTPFVRTGEQYFGYEKIVVPDGEEAWTKAREFFVRLTPSGEIASVLYCNTLDPGAARSNPQCSLNEEVGQFSVKAGFRRTLMPEIATIARHVRTFVSCLTLRPDP